MNKYTLQFVNKSFEKQYFDKVAFPYYNTIFSAWCKVLIMISIPCSLFTYFTGNLQYLGFIWCIITSTSCLLIIRYYKYTFNIVTAIYNVGFVVLNIGFILITNKNIGAQGQQNNMMFIFAGSQYMFHFILSIGSNFLLTSAVIFIQNFSYSAVFFPGQLNSFHGLLFFSMCFLIWMKYTNEKYQREVFILQENEKEWSQFVRDVLPSSVIMVKYDGINDQIQNKLVNRVAQTDYDIQDDQSLTQFLRNTTIQKDSLNNNQTTSSVTRISILKNSALVKNNRFSFQNGFSDTLERFIYYRFKTMIQKSTIVKSNNKPQTPTKKLLNINEENSQQIDQSNALQLNDPKQIKDSCNLTGVNFTCNRQKDYSPQSQSNTKEPDGLNSQKNNKRQSFFIKSPNSKSNKEKKEINQKQEKQPEDQQKKEKYNVEEFKAFIMKNNVKQEVLIKIVFYYTSQPVCSISIDEGLKQQVVNISRQSKLKESLYFQHFLRIAQKFQAVISCKNPVLFQTYSFLHLNHLRNLQDLISLKQDTKLKVKYTPFQFNNLLKYINSIFQPIFSSEGIQFSILIGQQTINKQHENVSSNQQDYFQFPSDINLVKLNLFSCSNINEKQNQGELPKKSLILQENNQNPLQNMNGYNNFEEFKSAIETFNDQQRINQAIINLLENALEFLKKSKTTNKYVQLKIDLIQGKDEQSNLIQIKVVNSTELNYSKQEIFLIKDSLRVERDLNNPNYLWQSQTSLKPTQLGLKLNQKILDRTSPYNYMDIICHEEQVEFSFFIYQNCSILLQNTQQNFTNKVFDQIRINQIEQSYMPSNCAIFANTHQQQYQDGDQSTAAYAIDQKIQQVNSEIQILQQSIQNDQAPNNTEIEATCKGNIPQYFSELDLQEMQSDQINNIVLNFDSKHIFHLNKNCKNKQTGKKD